MKVQDYSVSLPFSHTAGLRAIKWSWHALARQPNWAWIAREVAITQASMDSRATPLGSVDQYHWLWHFKNKIDCPWLKWKGDSFIHATRYNYSAQYETLCEMAMASPSLLSFLQGQSSLDFDFLCSGGLLVKSSIIDLEVLTIIISLWVKFWPL